MLPTLIKLENDNERSAKEGGASCSMPCTYLELFDVQKCRFCQHRFGKSCRSPRRCKALLVSALPAAATVVLTKLTISGAQSIADAVCRRTALHILNAAWAAAFCFRAAAFRQLWNNICGTYRKCGLCEGKSRGEITARTSVRKKTNSVSTGRFFVFLLSVSTASF